MMIVIYVTVYLKVKNHAIVNRDPMHAKLLELLEENKALREENARLRKDLELKPGTAKRSKICSIM